MTPSEKQNLLRSNILWIFVLAILGFTAGAWYLTPHHKTVVPAEAETEGGRKLVEARESLYNNIYVYSEGDLLSMTFGYNRNIYTESIYNTKDERDLPVLYTRYMTASLIYAGNVKSILEIGFGGGRTSWYLHRFLPETKIVSVELDPEIVKLARKYFGIKDEPNFNVANEDGRLYLVHSKEKYDIILVDAYRGPFVPFHLLTKEFYQLVKAHLAPGGVVAQNIEPTTMLFDSAVATLKSVFAHLDFYVMGGNVVTVAYDGPEHDDAELARMASERQKTYGFRYDLQDMIKQRRLSVAAGPDATLDPNAKILTDDFAPVEMLKAVTAHNRKWSEK